MEMQIIKLLNEFEKEKTKQDVRFWDYYQNGFHYLEDGQSYSELLMISKKYGFIKWLVENEKIMVIDKEIGTSEEDYICGTKYRLFKECYSDYEILLMLLSISDNPIEFLISLLK